MKTVAPGIRQKPSGEYLVTKSIKGERYYFTTDKLPEAKRWHRDFRPVPVNNFQKEVPSTNLKINGRDEVVTFGEVWKKYQKAHLSTTSEENQIRTKSRVDKFTQSLTHLRICQINEDVIEAVINERKILTRNPLRCNFNKELKFLNHIFTWYGLNLDHKFESPITGFHKRYGSVKAVPAKPKHITSDEFSIFVRELSGIWKDLAFMQLYMAGRISEAAGLTVDFIHLDKRKIEVSSVMGWIGGRPRLKKTTKTDTVSFVHINDHMTSIVERLELERPRNCPFLFQIDGEPLRYDWIVKAYNEAFKTAKLPYRATHVLRYGMAGIGGELLGDAGAKAVTRHGSMAMARKYRGKNRIIELTEENKQVVIHAEKLFKKEA